MSVAEPQQVEENEEHSDTEPEGAPSEPLRGSTPKSKPWSKMPGEGGKRRGPQCDYMLYRGNNAGGRCFRNGLHPKEGKLYCTNHFKIINSRMEKVGAPKREREEVTQQPQAEAQPQEPEQEEVEEQGQVERPTKRVRVLEAKDEQPPTDDNEDEEEDEYKRLKKKYKKKYQAKYAPKPKKPLIWETFTYKNPRKVLNRMLKEGGGVGPLFTLPRE
jgi:hypothetical protein